MAKNKLHENSSNINEPAYLDEESLGRFLRERLDINIIHNKRLYISKDVWVIPDYRSETHKVIIEFDGPQHFTKANIVVSDQDKDSIYESIGYTIVRIPYFIQLNEITIPHLFHDLIKDVSVFKNYKCGFIDDKVIYPADFCEIGLQKFFNIIYGFPFEIFEEIVNSIFEACEKSERDPLRFFPPSWLEELLAEDKTEDEIETPSSETIH